MRATVLLMALVAFVSTAFFCMAGEDSAKVLCSACQGNGNSATEAKHAALRYDGKTFDEWRQVLNTELQTERQIEAIKALGAFAANGHSQEVLASIAQFMRTPSRISPDEPERTRLTSAAISAVGRASDNDVEDMLAVWPPASSKLTEDFWRSVRAPFVVYTKTYPIAELLAASSSDAADAPDFDSFVTELRGQFPIGTWAEDRGKSDIQMFETNRTLVLSGTPAVHQRLEQLLGEERRTRPIVRSYDVAALVRAKNATGEVGVDFEPIVELITATVDPTSWDTAGGTGSIRENKETLMLMVHHRPAVQREVEQLLEQLRVLQVKTIPIAPVMP